MPYFLVGVLAMGVAGANGATLLRAIVPNISDFLALAIPIGMSVARVVGLNPLVAALVVIRARAWSRGRS